MSFLNIGSAASTAKAIDTVPGGEYKVEITYVKMNEEKGYMLVMLDVVDVVNAETVSLMLNLPGSGRTEKEENRNVNRLVEFYGAFGLNVNKEYNTDAAYPEGFIGATGWVILSDPKDDGKGYGEQNKVSRFVSGR